MSKTNHRDVSHGSKDQRDVGFDDVPGDGVRVPNDGAKGVL